MEREKEENTIKLEKGKRTGEERALYERDLNSERERDTRDLSAKDPQEREICAADELFLPDRRALHVELKKKRRRRRRKFFVLSCVS